MTVWLGMLAQSADHVCAVNPFPGSKHSGIEATFEKKPFEEVVSNALNLKRLKTVETGWDPVTRHS